MGKIVLVIPAYQPEEKMVALLEELAGGLRDSKRVPSEPLEPSEPSNSLEPLDSLGPLDPSETGKPAGAGNPAGAGETGDPAGESGVPCGIFVVDDGSGESFRPLFESARDLGCQVVRHEMNRGKGAAIRTGLRAAMDRFGSDIGVVTADADGQHRPSDILKIAAVLGERQREGLEPALVLGVRDFSGPRIPARSRIGNRLTALVFRLSTRVACRDTQTGLRGIPARLLPLALATEGDRYEYEMQFLMQAVREVPLVQVPIETVYEEGNRTSHFQPVRDSLLIYKRPLRFFVTAGASAAADWTLFLTLLHLLGRSAFAGQGVEAASCAAAASAIARVGSGAVNFTLNRRWSFQSNGRVRTEAVRYLILFGGNLLGNAAAVAALTYAGVPAALGKFLVDVALFLINYQVQKRWVFR